MSPMPRLICALFLWLWVLGVLAGYLYQFRDLIGPVARLIN